MINVLEHEALLTRILMHYGLPASSLEIVPDVAEWCAANDLEEQNPWRAAKCYYSATGCHIVMCDKLTDSMIASGKNAMECRGFEDAVMSLDSDRRYLVHLMLHEIACFTLQTPEQEPRDTWAFHEMAKHAA